MKDGIQELIKDTYKFCECHGVLDSKCPSRRKAGDAVASPAHYTKGKIEVIDFIEDQKLSFHLGNAIKYICRAGHKNTETFKEDLEKAVWYLQRCMRS